MITRTFFCARTMARMGQATSTLARARLASRPAKPAPAMTTCGLDCALMVVSRTAIIAHQPDKRRISTKCAPLTLPDGLVSPISATHIKPPPGSGHPSHANHRNDLEHQLGALSHRSRREVYQDGASRHSLFAGDQVPG